MEEVRIERLRFQLWQGGIVEDTDELASLLAEFGYTRRLQRRTPLTIERGTES